MEYSWAQSSYMKNQMARKLDNGMETGILIGACGY